MYAIYLLHSNALLPDLRDKPPNDVDGYKNH